MNCLGCGYDLVGLADEAERTGAALICPECGKNASAEEDTGFVCTQCAYPLWRIRERVCPECGTGFRPSSYTFGVNAVRYVCPHCTQDYYGTNDRGHLEPQEFDCVRCGRHLCMDEMVLVPRSAAPRAALRNVQNPWLEDNDTGWFRRYWKTWGMAFSKPKELMLATPDDSSAGRALLFALITVVGYVSIGVGAIALIAMVARGGSLTGLGVLAGALFGVLGALFVWAICTHGILWLIAKPKSLSRTVTALAFSTPTLVLMAVPMCGMYLLAPAALLWHAVVASIMIGAIHNVRGGRAATATLIPPAVAVLSGIGLLIFTIWSAQTAMTTAMAAGPTSAGVPFAASLASSLENHAFLANNTWPDHGARLIAQPGMSTMQFTHPARTFGGGFMTGGGTGYTPSAGSGLTLLNLQTMPSMQQTKAIDALAANLPSNVVAHRVGDVVFTYHGVPRVGQNPKLWVLIITPDPASPVPAGMSISHFVGYVDGTSAEIPDADFAAELQKQNARRTRVGLSPIPDPSTIAVGQGVGPSGSQPEDEEPEESAP
ncbi:MAG: hypothetical protein AB7Q00_02375 [Phycisphaerales bacterium]